MKTLTLIILGSLCFGVFTANAQDNEDKKNGIRAGYHMATMVIDGSKPDEGKSLSSFYAGFFRDQKIASILHFGKGIEYFQNGIKYTDNSKRVLHTVSIPLDLKLKIGPVFALGGAAPNIKVAEKVSLGDNTSNPIDTDKSNWFDVAAFAGAGVKISILTVEARYHWGLLKARDSGLYNRYFQLGAAVSF
jgi:hypothetical protein